ncbi:UvrD-helicase domain-containing protein [Brevibacillus porteri]|uniref:UvrD-helicase domain-containing protein n=1 Tax=Brevibacillus porteri TaxID=2126350 RepID=UPI003D1BA9C1
MFESLSTVQRSIVFEKNGRFVVRACPGSGKTYTTAARLAYRIQNWSSPCKGIAVLSFTNVAWKEIQKMLDGRLGITINYPHHLGTLDSFINKYIFLPFGHLIMGCGKRPTLVGEPHGTWSAGKHDYDYDRYFDCTSISVNDETIPTTADLTRFHFKWRNKDGSESGHVARIREAKVKYWGQGYATQADANYFSYKLLEKYPNIARSIAMRFPELVIDEAQDTSEIQMRIIDKLIFNSLENVMLVGDPDQAIFEWNDARPDLFLEKYYLWEENSVILDENRRSSQKICNVTNKLTSRAYPSVAVSESVKDFEHVPVIVCYKQDGIHTILDNFLRLCEKHQVEVNPENVAVIFRSKSIQNLIQEQPERMDDPWAVGNYFVRDLAKGKYLATKGNISEAYRLVERAVFKGLFKRSFCSASDLEAWVSSKGFVRHRKDITSIMAYLPAPTGDINNWVRKAERILRANNISLQMTLNRDCGEYSFEELFKTTTGDSLRFRLGTVHTVKGETFEAVLLVLKEKGAQGSFYRTMLTQGKKTYDDEELRIAYVGMTRPRKLLVLAVPSDQSKAVWEQRLLQ